MRYMSQKTVFVALSGGVDSAVAALLLREAGHRVVGVTMRLWSQEGPEFAAARQSCCSVEGAEDARRVCQLLGIPYYILNYERPFQERVVDYFCREYGAGRTPNPCLACNQHLKFDLLLQKARALGADELATGHYARIDPVGGRFRLRAAVDAAKDQSYALYALGQAELACLRFPLGDYTKVQARALAAARGLPVAAKPDSQEICFIPDGDYRAFLAGRLAPRPGPIVDTAGHVLGEHPGVHCFTVGQRRGLGNLRLARGGGQPIYVLGLEGNRVVVGPDDRAGGLWVGQAHWVSGQAPEGPLEVGVRVRYRAPLAAARLLPQGEGARVEFAVPQRGAAPGQAAVFYRGDEVMGGGVIAGSDLLPRQNGPCYDGRDRKGVPL